MIYASTTYAGAMLEKLVHTGRQIPKNQVCVVFEVPAAVSILTLGAGQHPGWESADGQVSRAAGDEWLAGAQSAVLLVPSVLFEIERNALINPNHPEATLIHTVSIEPVRWDDRLFTSV